MTEQKIVERQKIALNKIEYYLDSLDEDSQKLLAEIRIIDTELQRLHTQMNIAGVAKNYLLEKIDNNTDNFEKVPVVEEQEKQEQKISNEPDYINQ
jgi:hypothetical protein